MENNQLNKIQLKAEILTVISKLQANPDISKIDEILSVLLAQANKTDVMELLIKELIRSTEEKAVLICYMLMRLSDKDVLEERLWTLLKDRKVSDFAKSIVLNLLKDMGNKINYDEYSQYFQNAATVIDADTEKLLHVAIMNPEAQIDFMDFLSSLAADDREILVNSLGEDYTEDALANILIPVFVSDPYSPLAETALNILGLTKSQLAFHALEEAKDYLEGERLSLVKKNISALKISGVRRDDTDEFYRKVLDESRPYESYASFPDGHGNQALIFSREREDESIQMVAVVTNDKIGIVDCFGFNQISKFELSRIVDRFFSGDKYIYINATVLKTLLKKAEAISRKFDGKVSYEYVCWSNLLKDIPIEPVPMDTILSMKYVKHEVMDGILDALYMEDIVQRWFLDTQVSESFAQLAQELNVDFAKNDFSVDFDEVIEKNYDKIFSKSEKIIWNNRLLNTAYLCYLAADDALAQIFFAIYFDETAQDKLFKNILRKSIYEYYVALKFNLEEKKETTNIFALRNNKPENPLNEKQIRHVISKIEAKWVQNA